MRERARPPRARALLPPPSMSSIQYSLDEYTEISGDIVQALNTVLCSREHFVSLMNGAEEITAPCAEVSVSRGTQDGKHASVIACVILHAEAAQKLAFDKNKFTMLLRQHLGGIQVNVTKKLATDA
mmetsp:Transcript_63057/g.124646  ORF Transcript_63057/g.124646 Transcript_63057/m.124646 type:complete len:126 (-) Transcript_63057:63-440(-)